MMIWIKRIIQICFLYVLFMIGNFIATSFHISIPGSIIGLVILFVLLQSKIIRVEWVDLGANWLIAELLLFFVPSAVGVMKYKQMLGLEGVKIFLIIILSTIVVMIFTGFTAEILSKLRKDVKHESASPKH
ncbi:CidA/LrgA family protein [Heyndrickxia ginsengihumi]